jgi:predicted permease
MLPGLWGDLKYGCRLLYRRPAFSLTAVLVLTLGIGLNAALFIVVNGLLFVPLPVRAPSELFYIYQQVPEGRSSNPFMGAEELELLRTQTGRLAAYALHARFPATLSVSGETERQTGETVSGNYFTLLGVGTVLGRPLGVMDEDPTAPAAVVISHGLWARRFQSDYSVIGRQAQIDDLLVTIVGVTAPGFYGVTDRLTPSDFWIAGSQARHTAWGGVPIGRMEPDASFAQLEAAIVALSPRLAELELDRLRWVASQVSGSIPDKQADRIRRTRFPVRLASEVDMPFDPDLRLIPPALIGGVVGIVALVLLIATTNITGLLLARGVTRTGEVAVRRALGATRVRLTRQLLTETVLLSTVGGALGVGVAVITVGLFRANAPLRYVFETPIDQRVVLFVVGVCLITGVVAVLGPVRQAARVNVLQAIGGGGGGHPVRRRMRHAIVVPQVAISLLLLAVAAVQVRALLTTEFADRGYRPGGVIAFSIGRPTPRAWDSNVAREWLKRVQGLPRDIAARVQTLPQVGKFGFTSRLPIDPTQGGFRIIADSDALSERSPHSAAPWVLVTEGYFETMGMRLRGRDFDARDSGTSAKVAVLSESLARSLWPSGEPLGRRFAFMQGAQRTDWREVVGVVTDVKPVLDGGGDQRMAYLPVEQSPMSMAALILVVRGSEDPPALVQHVTRAVREAEPLVTVYRVRTLSQLLDEALYPRRLATTVLSAAGLAGLLLACIGLYGVVSYSAAQRVREIGIRATLGAEPGHLVSLILKDGVAAIAWGSTLGLVSAVCSLRWASQIVPGLSPGDVVTYVAVTAVVATIVAVACLLPAFRASRVDPAQVLRAQ